VYAFSYIVILKINTIISSSIGEFNSRRKYDPYHSPSPLIPRYDSPSPQDPSIPPVPPPPEGQGLGSPGLSPTNLKRKKVGFDYDEDENHEKHIGYL
jgi:hypothetical protein